MFKHLQAICITLIALNISCMENQDRDSGFEQYAKSLSQDDQEFTILGASMSCDLSFIRTFSKYLKKDISKEKGEHIILQAINNCTKHKDGAEIVDELAKIGIDLNYGQSNFTPLHQASAMANSTGKTEILEALLKNGANPDNRGQVSLSPLEVMQTLALKSDKHPNAGMITNLMKRYSKEQPLRYSRQLNSKPNDSFSIFNMIFGKKK